MKHSSSKTHLLLPTVGSLLSNNTNSLIAQYAYREHCYATSATIMELFYMYIYV